MSDDSASDPFGREHEGSVKLPRTELSESGQGGRSGNAIGVTYVSEAFDDFELQMEQLAGYDQQYIKTSTAPFRGRFTSAYLENGLAIDLEAVNCGMHQHVGCPEDRIGLCVSLGPQGTLANGVELDRNKLTLTRPGSELCVDVLPEGGKFLLLTATRSAWGATVSEDSRLGDFVRERGEASIVNSVHTAGGFTEGVLGLLQFCARLRGQELPESVAINLLAFVVPTLELEMDLDAAHGQKHGRSSYATFARARDALAAMEEFDYAALTAATGVSPRAIQIAFAQYSSTTPHRYFRILKLHQVRRALRADPGDRKATIGDIAAAHGFWSPSRFASLYRRQFGERPSVTRARAQPAH